MPRSSSAPPRSNQGVARSLGAATCLLLAIASGVHYERQLQSTKAADRFARDFSLELRAPSLPNTMRLQPAGDFASDIVVEVTLGAGSIPVRQEGRSPQLRTELAESEPHRDEELRRGRDLMLDAIAARPGWAYHHLLLGRVVLAADARSSARNPQARIELWAKPLWQAAAGAPGDDATWGALGDAYLAAWSQLPPEMRSQARSVLRRAFLASTFVSRAFAPAIAAIGRREAMSLLPETPDLLDVAVRALFRNGDIEGAALLAIRRDSVERTKRIADLLLLEQRNRRGDSEASRSMCEEWISKHGIGNFDDEVGRAQEARVLALWPLDDAGTWREDPRGKLVRFFLDGRESRVNGDTLAQSLELLSGVPPPILARVKLLAGDVEASEEMAAGAVDPDAPEWIQYFVQLARFELKRMRFSQAHSALERVAPGARRQCEVLLARRDVARAEGDSRSEETLDRMIESVRMGSHSADPGPGSPEATLSLCLEPEWAKGRVLLVEIEAASPAILVYGWDGGRSGTLAATESSTIMRIPLAGLSGSRRFSVRAWTGGPVRQLRGAVTVPNG